MSARKRTEPKPSGVEIGKTKRIGTKKTGRARSRATKPVPVATAPDAVALSPSRDIAQIPALSSALDLLADKGADRVLVKDFLTKCMAELKANNARLRVTVPAELSTPGACYVSNWPSNEVTIWDNRQIKGHMSIDDAVAAKIPACSVPRR